MTKKDYILVANSLAEVWAGNGIDGLGNVVFSLSQDFRKDNPWFDEAWFDKYIWDKCKELNPEKYKQDIGYFEQ